MALSQFDESISSLPKSERPILESYSKALHKKFSKDIIIHSALSASPTLMTDGLTVFTDDSLVVLKNKSGLFMKSTIEHIIPYEKIIDIDFDIKTVLINPHNMPLGVLHIKYKKTLGSTTLKLRNIDESKVQDYCDALKVLSSNKGKE